MRRVVLIASVLACVVGCALDTVDYDGRPCRTYLDCLVAQGYYCQPTDAGDGTDGGSLGVCLRRFDAGTEDGGRDASGDTSVDASGLDADLDAGTDDAGTDDAGTDDAGDDAGTDAGDDAGDDAGNDAGDDAGNDAGDDAGNDAA